MDAFRAALRWGYRHGLVGTDLFAKVEPMKIPDTPQASLRPEEVRIFLEKLAESELFLPAVVDLGPGLRRGELLGLQWRDIDWTASTLRVDRSLKNNDGTLQFCALKTRKSRRTLPLPRFVTAALERQRQQQAVRLEQIGVHQDDTIVVFDNLGAPWDPDAFTSAFHRAVHRTGAPRVRFHDLHHSFTSLGLASGSQLRVMSELLGHAGYAITADRYAHILGGMLTEAATSLDHLIAADVPV